MAQKATIDQSTTKNLTRLVSVSFWILLWLNATAQIPAGYYDPALGLTGPELKTALSNIIDNHTVLSYADLWDAFDDTDKKDNGKVWDMYSDVPGGTPPYEYTFITDQCGNYSKEGDCYNREHSFPRSWFSDASPMYTDMFHIVPTDGYVNGRRGNDPFGEVGTASFTSLNGSKSGTSSWPGYTGTVFEPIDEYKGDFARGYLYMATRYEDLISAWSSPMLDGTPYPAFSSWALSLLIAWHESDPVSMKEINRNDSIYTWQNNRNPFIDNPQYVDLIWGSQSPTLAITSTPPTSALVGALYEYFITTAAGNGNEVTITCPQKPQWLTFSAGASGSATLSGTPTEADIGAHSVKLLATDGESQTEQLFTITVEVSVPELLFTSIPVTTAQEGEHYSYDIEATLDGEPSPSIEYYAINIPAWLTLTNQDNGTASLYGLPSEEHVGLHNIELKAVSGPSEATQNFTIQVKSAASGTQYTETFTLMPGANSAYTDRTWIGDHGIEWRATHSRTDLSIDGRAICMKATVGSYLLSEVISGGVTSVSFEHQQQFTGSGGTLSLFINDSLIGEPVSVNTDIGFATFHGINITGDFTIKLVSNGGSRMAIDNLSWFDFTDDTGVDAPIASTIKLFPNPFNRILYLENARNMEKITFYNVMGQAVLHMDNPTGSVSTQHLKPGLYIIVLEESGENPLYIKMVKSEGRR